MFRVLKKLIKDKRGISGLLVFAILLPFLTAFIIAMAQLTIIGVSQTVVNNAAFEGARAGAMSASSASAARKEASKVGSNIFRDWNSKSKIKTSVSGGKLTVTVEYRFPIYAYFNIESIKIPRTVQASSSQKIENRP